MLLPGRCRIMSRCARSVIFDAHFPVQSTPGWRAATPRRRADRDIREWNLRSRGKRGKITRQDGYAQCQGLHQGHPEPFGERGEQQRSGVSQPAGQFLIAALGLVENLVLRVGTLPQLLDNRSALPAPLADHHQRRCAIAQLIDEPTPHVQQQGMVFPRLDGAENHEVILRHQRLIGGRRASVQAREGPQCTRAARSPWARA